MIQRFVAAAGIASLVLAAGCGAGGGGISTVSSNPVSPSYSSLQFAVGTANLYGNPIPRLNVVSTFRQSNGDSAGRPDPIPGPTPGPTHVHFADDVAPFRATVLVPVLRGVR